MRHTIIEHISKNGIRFHHSISIYKNNRIDGLAPETHDMFEIFLLLNGEIDYKIEGEYYHLTSMNAIIIPPNKLHSIEINTSKDYERMVLSFSPDLLPSFADLPLLTHYQNSPFSSFVISKQLIENFNLYTLMKQCKQLCHQQSKYIDLRFVSLILQIVENLNEMVLSLDETSITSPVKVHKISHDCTRYINQNLIKSASLSPQSIAKKLHISPSHLQHTFKKEMGITLHDYIFNQRMQLAYKLLLQGHTPQYVANILNYEYYSTFYHNFVKRFHVSPNFYRDKSQINKNNLKNN